MTQDRSLCASVSDPGRMPILTVSVGEAAPSSSSKRPRPPLTWQLAQDSVLKRGPRLLLWKNTVLRVRKVVLE